VINRPEAAAVAKTVVDCLHDPRYIGKSMGVICLQGHAQAQLIEQLLLDAIGPTPFSERQLICGDAYSFQGDERDVIFMSLVAASEGQGRVGPLVKETFHQRFNVAASRARDQVWLFHSVVRNELNPECMRRRLLDSYYNPANEALATDLTVCESQFERDVATALISRNYRIIPQYPYAGKRIDLVVEGTKSRLAIECDGDEWHGPDRYEADMQRQRILERAGWKFARVRGSSFYAGRQAEVTRLLAEIEAQEIQPITDEALIDTKCSSIGEVRGQSCVEFLEGYIDTRTNH
jgi:very-short-patch-repair endonuclease